VRHLVGYEPLLELCRSTGTDPSSLASDVAEFAEFARTHRDVIRAMKLEHAAATFLGNVLVQQRDDAEWIQYGDEFPSAGTKRQHYEVIHLLPLLMDGDDAVFASCVEKIEEWVEFSE
jgi:hypothetical protein